MKVFKITATICLVLGLSFFGNSQTGIVSGTIIDQGFQDPVPFANVIVKDLQKGTSSDFDGSYELVLEEGEYTLIFSFLGYKTVEISDVIVQVDQVNVLNVTLEELSQGLDEVVVTVSARQNTEQAVLTFQKKSVSLLDGLSSQSFKKTGASDIASAVKNVPGVSVQGGKYVYVRGLGDRYTKSILNGIDIPGLDPDRNTIQMDLFPTNILDNVLVIKSATADMPADFTGGIVNVITKEFPTQKEWSVSIGTSANPNMHFNSDALDYEGGKTDFLGFDDGTRSLPTNPNANYSPIEVINNPILTEVTKKFTPTLAAERKSKGPNLSLSISGGNQFNIGESGNKLGFFGSLSYKNNSTFYKNAEDNTYRRSSNKSVYDIEVNRTQIGDLSTDNVILSGMTGVSFKTNTSKYKLNLLHIQNGQSTSGVFDQSLRFSDFENYLKDNLEYVERSISNVLLSGDHSILDGSWKVAWKLSPTRSSIQDKDVRTTAFRINDEGGFSIPQNLRPTRIWRDLQEVNVVGKLDVTKKLTLFGRDARLKTGGYASFKERDFDIYKYEIAISGFKGISEGDSNQILAADNIWSLENPEGNYIDLLSTVAEQGTSFSAKQITFAGYFSSEFKVSESLRTVLGLRVEKFDVFYTGVNSSGKIALINAKVIDKIDLFPSANFIYALTDEKNIRLSYSKTTARPSFKEVSIAEIFDPLSNRTFLGNINLEPTYIDNLDLRYEIFGENASFFAISGFYKSFKDPIELTYSEAAANNFQPKNLGNAEVFGVELEVRKNLDFMGADNWNVNLNTSIIKSKQDFSESEYNLRLLGLREGETIEKSRTLQGQSPLLINAGLTYNNEDNGILSGLYYNVQGKTLEIVGTGVVPDVYTLPFHSLNFNFSKNFGKDKKHAITLQISNVLDSKRESQYESFKAENKIFTLRELGRTFSVGYQIQL